MGLKLYSGEPFKPLKVENYATEFKGFLHFSYLIT